MTERQTNKPENNMPLHTESDVLSRVLMLNEISAILYQVNDFDTALDMVLDTCTEYLKLGKVGILAEDKGAGVFKLIRHRFFENELAGNLKFRLSDSLNGIPITGTQPSQIEITDQVICLKSGEKIQAGNLTSLSLFPISFHDKLLGFLAIAQAGNAEQPDADLLKLLQIVSVLVAPVMYSFDAVCKSDRKAENIISKIIRDRMYEAQMVLSPISFSLFRIIPDGNFEHSLPLEEAISANHKIFSNRLDALGDTIWLTPDTIFFIYPKADLFKTESLCASLKQEIESQFSENDNDFSFLLRYVCLGYPQSGKDTNEIINNLWLKLFEEMSGLNNKTRFLEQNAFNKL